MRPNPVALSRSTASAVRPDDGSASRYLIGRSPRADIPCRKSCPTPSDGGRTRSLRRLTLPALLCVLALSLAAPALAQAKPAASHGAGDAAGQTFTCLGRVTTVDQTAGTITVTVKRASIALQGSVGQSLTLTVTADSVLATRAHCATTAVTLGDVSAGELLVARGTIDSSDPDAPVYDLVKALVWHPAAHARFLCRGTVTSVDLQAGALVVHVCRGSRGLRGSAGKDVNIDLAAGAKIFVAQGRAVTAGAIGDITAGDRVCIVGRADRTDPSAPVFTASCVVVRHVVPVGQLKWFACLGSVSAVDQTAGTITVTVTRGSRAVHGDVGSDLDPHRDARQRDPHVRRRRRHHGDAHTRSRGRLDRSSRGRSITATPARPSTTSGAPSSGSRASESPRSWGARAHEADSRDGAGAAGWPPPPRPDYETPRRKAAITVSISP